MKVMYVPILGPPILGPGYCSYHNTIPNFLLCLFQTPGHLQMNQKMKKLELLPGLRMGLLI